MATAKPRLVALVVAAAMFMAQLDGAVIALVLPQMAETFRVTPVDMSAGVSVYLIVQAVLLPTSAWIADRFGTRRVFALALVGFVVTSIACGVSRNFPEFLVARALQGATAALMTPVGRIAMLQSTDKRDLVSAISISATPMLLAPSLGPVIGGLVVTYWSWPWIFYLNVPVGLAAAILVIRVFPRSPSVERRPFDALGFLYWGGALALSLSALERLSALDAIWPVAMLAAGLLLGVLAVGRARRHSHGVLPLDAVKIRTYSATTIGGGALVRLPLRALAFLLPLLFQTALGFDVMLAAVLMMVLNGSDLAVKAFTTQSFRRFGFRRVILWTAFIGVISAAACAAFSSSTPLWAIAAVLIVSGLARSLLFTGISTLAFADIPVERMSGASVLWNVVQQVTNAMAVSLSALLIQLSLLMHGAPEAAPQAEDFQLAFLILSAVGLAALLSFRRLKPDDGQELLARAT